MTSDELAERVSEIRERCEKATEGPWILATSNSWRRFLRPSGESVCVPVTQNTEDRHPDLLLPNHNGEFIAEARTDLPDLLSVLDEVKDGLALIPDDEWGTILARFINQYDQDAAETLGAVRDLYLREEETA